MPVMTGTEFAAIAKDKQPKARTLLISGYINEKEAAAAIENEHINRFVAKPWHNEDILSIVESELQIGDTILSEKKIDSEPILLNAS
jgi:response regulator RpfG family c-di-GMP phosphodiesterase